MLISSFLQPYRGEQGQKVSLDNSILVSHSGRGAGFPEVGHYAQIVSFQFRKATESKRNRFNLQRDFFYSSL